MTQGETLISIILLVIIYFLYQIARQLSYLTGKKITFPFFNLQQYKVTLPPKKSKKQSSDHLPN